MEKKVDNDNDNENENENDNEKGRRTEANQSLQRTEYRR